MTSTEVQPVEGPREMSFLMSRDPSIDGRYRPRPEPKICIFDDIEENESDVELDLPTEESNSDYSSNVESNSVEETRNNASEGASIFLRFRPVHENSNIYMICGKKLIINVPDAATSRVMKTTVEKHFTFSSIFDKFVTQKSVYAECVQEKIEAEENFSILAYGTSGSGKTYTLLGTHDNPGIIPRALEHIFTLYQGSMYPQPAMKLINAKVNILDDMAIKEENEVRKHLLSLCSDVKMEYERMHSVIKSECAFDAKNGNECSIVIWISFAELYNEMVYDLLVPPNSLHSTTASFKFKMPTKRNHLKVIPNNGKVFVKGLTSVYVKDSKEALQLLRYGLQNVSYASTSINSNSSRSHCIIFVDILKYYSNGEIIELSYKFSDLAGSERLHKTGNAGIRLKEAQSINTSLLVLGRCLDVANTNRTKRNADVIPVRDSKLTLLLQSALLGKEKLAMIVTLQPTEEYFEENLHVLGFSSIAKNILYKQPEVVRKRTRYSLLFGLSTTKVTDTMNTESIDCLLRENVFLRSEIDRLQAEISTLQESQRVELNRQENEIRVSVSECYEELMEKQKKDFEERLRSTVARLQRRHEIEIERLKQDHEDELEELRNDDDSNSD